MESEEPRGLDCLVSIDCSCDYSSHHIAHMENEKRGCVYRFTSTCPISRALPEIPPRYLCGALARPGVVWFGESLPQRVLPDALRAVKSSQVLLVVGTSAVVYPAAELIPLAKAEKHKVIEINPAETPFSKMVDCSFRGPAGEILPRLISELSGSTNPSQSRTAS